MSRDKSLGGDRFQQSEKPVTKALSGCAAHGCPLPGTIKPESGEYVCSVHFLANPNGWPKATAVILDHTQLRKLACDALSAGTPMSMSAASAALLFESAKAHGLKFNDEQRAVYKRSGMKLRAAGELVIATISALAVKAAFVAPESNADYSHEREEAEFNLSVRGLTNNLRMAA